MKTKLLLLITLSIGLIANCSSSQKYELVKQKSNLNHVVLRNAQFFQDEKFALVNSDLIDLEKVLKIQMRYFLQKIIKQ